jgi:hypothetical protein
MIEPAEIRQIVREEITNLLAQERSQLLAEIRMLLSNVRAEATTTDLQSQPTASEQTVNETEVIAIAISTSRQVLVSLALMIFLGQI